MKTLYLVRHADAVESTTYPEEYDLYRPLTPKGMQQATQLGVYCASLSIQPDSIIVSPATRTIQTTQLIMTEIDYQSDYFVTDERLWDAPNVQDFLGLLGELPDDVDSVLIVGHNPSLLSFLQHIDTSHTSFKKAEMITIHRPSDRWENLTHPQIQGSFLPTSE